MVRYNGCVDWFNSKKGYGFITVHKHDDFKDTRLFCHQTNIVCRDNNTFRKVFPGEYISFEINPTTRGFEAIKIKGINEGDLLVDNSDYIYKM